MRSVAAIVTCILMTSVVSAQQRVTFGAGAQAGIAISAFPDVVKDYYGLGYGGGGHFDVNFIPALTARMNIEYFTFASDKDKLKKVLAPRFGILPSDITNLSGGGIGVFIVTVNAIGKVPTGTDITPYGLFGFGIHSISLSDLTGSDNRGRSGTATASDIGYSTQTKFGLNFGIGAEYRVARSVTLNLEFRYVLVFTDNQSSAAMPITVGATFGF